MGFPTHVRAQAVWSQSSSGVELQEVDSVGTSGPEVHDREADALGESSFAAHAMAAQLSRSCCLPSKSSEVRLHTRCYRLLVCDMLCILNPSQQRARKPQQHNSANGSLLTHIHAPKSKGRTLVQGPDHQRCETSNPLIWGVEEKQRARKLRDRTPVEEYLSPE